MRQTLPKLALLASLVLGCTPVSAEPILGGHYLSPQPGKSGGSPTFLAHIFNSDRDDLTAGSYQIGLELSGKKGRRVFVLKPNVDVPAGSLQTFRLPVVTNADEKEGTFRIFGRFTGNTTYSDSYSFDNLRPGRQADQGIPLYTEAPPEGEIPAPPPEIPFEGESRSHATAAQAKTAATAKKATPLVVENKKVKASPAIASASKPQVTETPKATVTAARPAIDGKEFKSLRTIDEELIIYVVKPNDTLKSLAQKYYGDTSKDRTIADLNFIDRQGSIKTGEEIIVEVKPLGTSAKETKAEKAVKAASASEQDAPAKKSSPKKSGSKAKSAKTGKQA